MTRLRTLFAWTPYALAVLGITALVAWVAYYRCMT